MTILYRSSSNKLEQNSEKRAEELSVLLTQLGPSFIKVGQSLSIRTDLLSPAYVKGLKALQDQVPPFPTSQAITIIEEELGTPIQELFSEFSNEPVAAASLGQVYKAKLKADGREVAVKVQRPNIMNQIALDMHLLRYSSHLNSLSIHIILKDVCLLLHCMLQRNSTMDKRYFQIKYRSGGCCRHLGSGFCR